MDHYLELDPTPDRELPQLLNPLLCSQCQGWNDIELHKSGSCIQNFVSIEELSRNSLCLICQAVLAVFNIRRHTLSTLQPWPDSRILIEVLGPLYLDTVSSNQRELDLSNSNNIPIRMFLRLTVRVPKDDFEVTSSNRPIDSLSKEYPTREFVTPREKQQTLFTVTPQFCLYYSLNNTSTLCKIEEWAVPLFNKSVIRSWIRGCDTIHGNKCTEPPHQTLEFPPGFRVVDVVNMNIAKPVGPIRYVALSYMWGSAAGGQNDFQLEKKNVRYLEAPGSLTDSNIPKVIADAISLCRDLGEVYLWIDRLCIVQDDQEQKPAQIAAMDKIYRSATFTLVAALNNPNGDGLPGHQGKPRDLYSSIWIPPYDANVETRGISPNGIGSLVDSSLWNRRGWTFQERLLSRRCLFITEHQAMFKCSQAEASEELTWSPQSPRKPNPPAVLDDSLASSNIEYGNDLNECKIYQIPGYFELHSYGTKTEYIVKGTASLAEYCGWVQNYTSRQLSYGTDILHAFTGVAKYLSRLLACPMLFGLPEKYLPQCLMWSCPRETGRRGEMPEIPSWSWAVALSAVSYDWISGNNWLSQDVLETASLVFFYYQDPACGLRKLNIQERWIQHEVTIEEVANQAELPILTHKALPSDWRTNRDWEDCPHNPSQTFARQVLNAEACRFATMFPGSLVFNTTVASLGIDFSKSNIENDHNAQNASICNEGTIVGHLNMMSFAWINTRRTTPGNRKLFDFIVISGALQPLSTRKWHAFLRQHDHIWQLRVMLVERLACKPFVARRVDVGAISLCDWKQCRPRWETVVLC
ncbi:HET-domain-containing protein [Daldinia decipiens]|uniref:HET-domain-containing protein n=1 Tax=Daldinia decipiens TaxID=326647 RepID=UPI0020C1BA44|nr:HET-domain-containing protein [Daldinia decipiens]KAI1655573.1 HET-domain-containing protein [Daldinia decipiens]